MATLPGLPHNDDDPEPDALPVEPDDGATTIPGAPEKVGPGHEPVQPSKA